MGMMNFAKKNGRLKLAAMALTLSFGHSTLAESRPEPKPEPVAKLGSPVKPPPFENFEVDPRGDFSVCKVKAESWVLAKGESYNLCRSEDTLGNSGATIINAMLLGGTIFDKLAILGAGRFSIEQRRCVIVEIRQPFKATAMAATDKQLCVFITKM